MIAQWWRDTVPSVSTRSLPGAVPTENSNADDSRESPRSGPLATRRQKRRMRISRGRSSAEVCPEY